MIVYETQVVTGFVTNSSSMICWFDRKLLEHPDVRAWVDAYGIGEGFIGTDMWHRGACGSILMTLEQKADAMAELNSADYGDFDLGDNPDEFVVIYGDEYTSLASEFCNVLSNAVGAGWNGARLRSREFN